MELKLNKVQKKSIISAFNLLFIGKFLSIFYQSALSNILNVQ